MNNFKKILVTGGAGYCGGVLIPLLLKKGYKVIVYDIMFFGFGHLPKDPNLEIIKADIRDINQFNDSLGDVDVVLHLACISNDSSFVLNEKLSETINYDAFEPLVISSKKFGVKRFIYASSSSVYGVSEKLNVTEEHPLVPLTLYNKFKGLCEPLLFKHIDNDFEGVVFRPATVCGYSPRLRLDVSVNILTNYAVNKGFIKVFGGQQMRPNLHILDYADLCLKLIEAPKDKINGEIFNCGHENLKIIKIADSIKSLIEQKYDKEISINIKESDDNRSYHINSDKVKRILNFVPKLSIQDAVSGLCESFENKLIPDSFENDIYYNVKTIMKSDIK